VVGHDRVGFKTSQIHGHIFLNLYQSHPIDQCGPMCIGGDEYPQKSWSFIFLVSIFLNFHFFELFMCFYFNFFFLVISLCENIWCKVNLVLFILLKNRWFSNHCCYCFYFG
jgi:hypothetical protein